MARPLDAAASWALHSAAELRHQVDSVVQDVNSRPEPAPFVATIPRFRACSMSLSG
jgi:hypothetical protein